jgi:3-hydroxyisobutyrate dehydrogenase
MTPFRKITKNHRLGFIGLGHLGSPMARRLLAAGFPLVVYNRDTNKTDAFAALGAKWRVTQPKLAAEVDVVLSCVPDGAAVETVYLGPAASCETPNPAR